MVAILFFAQVSYAEEEEKKCWQIQEIVVVGAGKLDPDIAQRIKKNYQKRCLNAGEITSVLSDLTNWYGENGYITTRVYLPEQNLEGGVLKIKVEEGRVEKIEYPLSSWERSGNIFPGIENKVLNLRDIEQGIEQLGRVKSNRVHVAIKPGSKPGSSIITVDNKPEKRWRMRLSANNYGSKSKGERQAVTSLSYDDLLGFNESYALGYVTNVDDLSEKRFRAIQINFTVPVGYHNFAVNYDKSHYRFLISGYKRKYQSTGGSNILKFNIDSCLLRDSKSKTVSSVAYGRETYANFIAGHRIELSSYNLKKYLVGIFHQRRIGNSVLGAGLSLTKGRMGSFAFNFGKMNVPARNFTKYNFDASLFTVFPFKLIKEQITPQFHLAFH